MHKMKLAELVGKQNLCESCVKRLHVQALTDHSAQFAAADLLAQQMAVPLKHSDVLPLVNRQVQLRKDFVSWFSQRGRGLFFA